MRKRLFALLLVICMLSFFVAGCASKSTGVQEQDSTSTAASGNKADSKGTESGDSAVSDSKYQTTYGSKQFDNVTIKVELFDRSNAPEGSTITDNKWVKYVNEQMGKVGINVEFVTVPRWDEVVKMQSMMASGTAPDITLTYTYAHAEDYFQQGGTWDLVPFIDGAGQADNMKAYLGDSVLNIGRTVNNELYGIVAKRAVTTKSNFFIRKDWLDGLNRKAPTTVDELYDTIKQFVRENPDGRKDVIGAQFWNQWNTRLLFSELAGNEKKMAISSGDSAVGDYYDKGIREFFRFMNKLYNEGLLNPEYYTLSEDDFKSQIVTGQLAFFEYSVNGSVDVLRGSLLKTLQENIPAADIISIPPMKNVNDGKQYSDAYPEGGLIAFCPLTASEEVVEACMTYLDWMCTKDGGFVLYHGFEDEHFTFDADGVPIVKDASYNSTDKDWIRTDIFLTGNQGYFFTVDDFMVCSSKEAPGYEDKVIENYKNAAIGDIVFDSTFTSASTPNLITDIDIIKDDYRVQCITCTPDKFDATYDEYLSELEGASVQTIIEERTEHFDSIYD